MQVESNAIDCRQIKKKEYIMQRVLIALLFVLALSACGGAPALPPSTAHQALDEIQASGIQVANIAPGTRAPNSPLPDSYKEHLTFTIPSLGTKDGQILSCDTKQDCDAIY